LARTNGVLYHLVTVQLLAGTETHGGDIKMKIQHRHLGESCWTNEVRRCNSFDWKQGCEQSICHSLRMDGHGLKGYLSRRKGPLYFGSAFPFTWHFKRILKWNDDTREWE